VDFLFILDSPPPPEHLPSFLYSPFPAPIRPPSCAWAIPSGWFPPPCRTSFHPFWSTEFSIVVRGTPAILFLQFFCLKWFTTFVLSKQTPRHGLGGLLESATEPNYAVFAPPLLEKQPDDFHRFFWYRFQPFPPDGALLYFACPLPMHDPVVLTCGLSSYLTPFPLGFLSPADRSLTPLYPSPPIHFPRIDAAFPP